MRRIIAVFSVMAIMAAMLVVLAMPAFAVHGTPAVGKPPVSSPGTACEKTDAAHICAGGEIEPGSSRDEKEDTTIFISSWNAQTVAV